MPTMTETLTKPKRGARVALGVALSALLVFGGGGVANAASGAVHWRPWQSGFKSIQTCENRWNYLKSSGLAKQYGFYDHQCLRDLDNGPWPPYKYKLWVLEDDPYKPCGC